MINFLNSGSGFQNERIHARGGEIDQRTGAHLVYRFIAALVIGFDVFHLTEQSLGREKIQIRRIRLALSVVEGQEDAPEKTIRMRADVNMVESVPVLFHFPDEILIGRELVGILRLGRFPNLDRP